jgi:hypothetical protein
MAISKELMLALLALDSYNRGYGQGITGLGDAGAKIGNATMLNVPIPSGSQATGFYASAYTLDKAVGDMPAGTKIISYRDTESDGDYTRGWSISPGLASNYTQADEALAFYKAIIGQDYWQGSAANTTLTGHLFHRMRLVA